MKVPQIIHDDVLACGSGLVVVTRHADQPVGARIEYDNNGKIKTISNCAREVLIVHVCRRSFHVFFV